MKRAFVGMLLGVSAAAALAVAPATAQELTAEVLHWWTSGGESAAVKEFAKAFNDAGGKWVDDAIAGGENARAAGINRIIGGDPPTAMQFNTGKQFDDLVAQGLLTPLDDVAEAEGWKALLPPALLDAVTRDGHIYAVPVNVHGQNWLWYSKEAFEKAGAAAPESWDDFFAAADKLKAAGYIPLALGAQPWQLSLTFNAVLVGEGGTDLYLKVTRERDLDAVRSPAFRKVVETFARLRDLDDEGSPNRAWNDAASMLITGKAGMQFMGDWEKGEFIAAGWEAGNQYGCILGPGDKAFVMGGDIFVFPKTDDPDAQKAQKLLARVMLSPEAQIAFNNKKGSVPVRPDVDTSKMDACAQVGLEVLKDPSQQIPVRDMLLSPDLVGAMNDITAEFWANPDASVDSFIETFVNTLQQAG